MACLLMCNMKLIGTVLKAQGIKGKIKISCMADSPSVLSKLKQVYIDKICYDVEGVETSASSCFLQLVGVYDRNAAEELRGCSVFAEEAQLVLPQDSYFIADMIGCVVNLTDGSNVGKISNVLQYGAADVIECKQSKLSFPFVKGLAVSVDIAHKSIVLDAKRFAEVALYED